MQYITQITQLTHSLQNHLTVTKFRTVVTVNRAVVLSTDQQLKTCGQSIKIYYRSWPRSSQNTIWKS